MNTQPPDSDESAKPTPEKAPYTPPMVIELGKLKDIIQNVVPGSTSDILGSGFDPFPSS